MDNNRAVRVKGSGDFRAGDGVSIKGVLLPRTDLPDGSVRDGYWGSFSGFCPDSDEVRSDEVIRVTAIEHLAG